VDCPAPSCSWTGGRQVPRLASVRWTPVQARTGLPLYRRCADRVNPEDRRKRSVDLAPCLQTGLHDQATSATAASWAAAGPVDCRMAVGGERMDLADS